jgi:hypothetical protein
MATDEHSTNEIKRRRFLKAGIGTMASLAAAGGVLEPLRSVEGGMSLDSFLQQHYLWTRMDWIRCCVG